MNEKEVSEIRRRFRPDKNNIRSIRGCYVNKEGEMISQLNQSLALMPQEEAENCISILKKTLSGTLNKNLLNIEFSTQQVVDSEEHRLLMALKDSSLKDEEVIEQFFQKVIQSVHMDENYLILLTHDTYDVPFRSKDGERQDDNSSEVYSYILCSVCPVKLTKPALGYYVTENAFRNCKTDWVVSPPKLGFLFPAFDERSTNIYSALFYVQDTSETHSEFVDTVFHCNVPMPADEQKEMFQSILCESLEKECDFDTVCAVQEHLKNMIEEHKANKEEAPLTISKNHVSRILETQGVSKEHIESFEQQYDEQFGSDTNLSPKNLVDSKNTVVTAPNIKIQISGESDQLVETRIINGIKYILIRAEDGVEVNGVPVHITPE
ncbi:MAG: DUF4317 domain-containing protein [Clostridium sp.]|uniref:DUF4317 domain-containing protein n=1 Tax=Clostridium sp. TaxID=1506 RepID=UPI0029106C0E|nr:DUF4317 domain-containing protein [Clostridium sp.]MDU7337692.1 DUF4317 domain-containing protein [Clostridium sp.]